MVAKKTQKAAKFTYTERVLGAFSQIQKDHRKHAVHMATLKTQVRKTAEAKKDRLGPQWETWVKKTVHKLKDEGIFASSDTAGSVVLTPNGHSAITAARRGLPITIHGTPASTTRSSKRSRRISSISHADPDDSDAEYGTDSPTKTYPLKRARIPLGAAASRKGEHPSHKMTKAELIAELHSLQTAHERAMLRATSPLTDIDDDEDGQEDMTCLQAELRQREQEIASIRLELVDARRTADNDDGRTEPDRENYLFFTPEPSQPGALAPMATPSGAKRTASGSLIPEHSKQPTPAPSSPGGAVEDIDETQHMHARDGSHASVAGRVTHLATPQPSPARPESAFSAVKAREAGLAQELARYKTMYNEVKQAFDAEQKTVQEKVTNLARTVANRTAELETTRKELSALHGHFSDFETRVVEPDKARIRDLEAQIKSSSEEVATQAAHITLKDQELAALQLTNADLQASSKNSVCQLEDMVRELGQANEALKSENLALSSELSAQRVLTVATNEEVLEHISNVTELERALAESETLRQEYSALNGSLAAQLAESLTQKSAIERSLAATQVSVDSLESQVSTMGVALTSHEDLEASLRSQLVADADKYKQDLDTLKTKSKGLSDANEASQRQVTSLETELAARASEVSDLSSRLTEARNTNTAQEGQLKRHRSELLDAQRQLHSTENNLSDVLGKLTKLTGVEAASELLRSELDSLRTSFDAAQQRVAVLEENLAAETAKVERQVAQIKELQDSKAAGEARYAHLKGLFVGMKETQLRLLSEFGDQIAIV